MNIIFDLDGTLLDSRERHVRVLEKCLEQFSLNYSLDNFLFYKTSGYSTKDYLIHQLGLDTMISQKITNMWIDQIEDFGYLKNDRLYDDSLDTLQHCKSLDYKLYLVSARNSAEYLLQQTEALQLSPFFEKIICVSPRNAVENKEKYIIETKSTFIIGDTEVEWSAAKQTGIKSYLLNRGFRSAYYWNQLGVESFASLTYLIEYLLL